jgi:hypothetical protein
VAENPNPRTSSRWTVFREAVADVYHVLVLPLLGVVLAVALLWLLLSPGGGSHSVRQDLLRMEAERARQQREDLDRRIRRAAEQDEQLRRSARNPN